MAEIHSFGNRPLCTHAWNADRSQIAISPNNHEVEIYSKNGKQWKLLHTLSEHTGRVTGIDWAPQSNRLVTCASDRNAYVWVLKNNVWCPTLVILRINRAATCVKWSPKEDKFAVGSAARLISVCYFEEENDWWVSKHIKKPLRSTVLCLSWHPNNILIAAGSSDFKGRVFSGYIKDIEPKPTATVWGKKMTFGNVMQEFTSPCDGWVQGIAFSQSGDRLAFVGQDSTICVAHGGQEMVVIKTNHLPFTDCAWITENCVVAAGHDYNPMVFSCNDQCNQLTFMCKLDQKAKGSGNQQMSAMAKFRMMDKKASTNEDTDVATRHKNSIMNIANYGQNQVSTCGMDGTIIIWNCKTLESQIQGLKIV